MEYSQVNTWGEGQVTLVAWSDTTQIRDEGSYLVGSPLTS